MEEDGWLNGLYTDESEESLFVSVYENGSYLVKIYDLSTMEERQVLDLDNMGATGKMSLYPFDDFLLIAGWRFRENADPGEGEDGFYISLYDETGLVYYGLYKTSLDTGESRDEAIHSCEPDDYYNFSVEWSEQP